MILCIFSKLEDISWHSVLSIMSLHSCSYRAGATQVEEEVRSGYLTEIMSLAHLISPLEWQADSFSWSFC